MLQRSSLIAKKAAIFEEAGFTHSKIVFEADSEANKLKHSNIEKKLTGSAAASGTLDEAIGI